MYPRETYFNKKINEGGVEIKFRCTQKDYEALKYACENGFDEGSFEIETVIRYLLSHEINYLQLCSGEVEKFRWELFRQGKNTEVALRETNPELYKFKPGLFTDKKIPTFKPALKRVGRE